MFSKRVTAYVAGMATVSLLAFTAGQYEVRKSTSEVNRQDGLYVFHDAMPVMEYEVLGQVKASGVASSQYANNRDTLVKKAKKQFPNADGIIATADAYHAEAIRFK